MTTTTNTAIIATLKARHVELSKAPAKAFKVLLARLAASKAAYRNGDLRGAKVLAHDAARTLRMMLNSKLPQAIRFSGRVGFAYATNGGYNAYAYLSGKPYADFVTVESGRAFSRLIAA